MAKAQSQKKSTPTPSEKTKSGVRPVSRKLVNAVARDRRADLPVADLLKRQAYRATIIARSNDPKLSELRQRYIAEESVYTRALELYGQFQSVGVTWGACVQAVKTDWVSEFLNKWGEKKRAVKDAERATRAENAPRRDFKHKNNKKHSRA